MLSEGFKRKRGDRTIRRILALRMNASIGKCELPIVKRSMDARRGKLGLEQVKIAQLLSERSANSIIAYTRSSFFA
jgi:hypothetical protein